MAIRDSLHTQATGPAGLVDVEEARVAQGALVFPHTSSVKAKSGFRPGPTSPGAVTATGTPDGVVHVSPFQLFLQGGRGSVSGVYVACADAIVDVNVLTGAGSTPADPTNPRNDLIIAQQSDTFYGDGTSPFEIKRITGTPSGSPADPTIPGSSDHITLARVRVDAAATTIVSGKITDLRTTGHAKSLSGGLYSVALGGTLPVASTTERNALSGVYDGMTVWRQDLKRIEVYNGSVWTAASPYQARQTVSGTAGAISFSNIPSTLRRLMVYWTARSNDAASNVLMQMRINNDATGQYHDEFTAVVGTGTPASLAESGTTAWRVGRVAGAGNAAGVFGVGEIKLIGWDSPHTNHMGMISNSGVVAAAGANTIEDARGSYAAAGPYNRIDLFPSAGSFITGTDVQLEGWE